MDMVGYIYNADNFPQTFRAGDKVYVLPGSDIVQGQIHLLDTEAGPQLKRIYTDVYQGAYCLTDELPANEPQREENPAIIGLVVGYERMFNAEDAARPGM